MFPEFLPHMLSQWVSFIPVASTAIFKVTMIPTFHFPSTYFFFWVLGSEGLVQPGPPIWIPEDGINFSTFTDTQENSPPPQPPVFAVLKKGITNHPIQSYQP